ncbi:MAG: alpha-L-fucosidase [Verrucomicrobiota bacterium]
MNIPARIITACSLLAATGVTAAAESPYPSYPYANEATAQKDARMAWWREAKFGMFIHWGLYAVPADGEWHMRNKKQSLADYAKFASQFNPTKFNADEWMALAHDTGMKYLVITSRHHDGFAMFDSKASDYNIVAATPFKRDPLKELAAACPRHDVRFGLYYSHFADWGHPGGGAGCEHWDKAAQDGDFNAYVDKVAVPQLRELMTNYGPVAELWFDTDGAPNTPAASNKLFEELKRQPGIIINPRAGRGDFGTAERHIAPQPPAGDWESCDIIVNGSWGYVKQPARPLPEIFSPMLNAWSKGGNVLLNVGPSAEGVIPADVAERLQQIGTWMRVNGEAIYGSTRSPFAYLPWGRCTRKGDMLYLHVQHWPANGTLQLPLANKVTKAFLLADRTKPLACATQDGKLLIHLPAAAPDPLASVVAVQLEGEPVPTYSLARNMPTTTSAGDGRLAVDDSPSSMWEFEHAPSGWLEVDLQKPTTFGVVRIGAMGNKIKHYAVKYQDGDQWRVLFEGENLPADEFVKTFPAVTAQHVRVEFSGLTEKLRLNSFELFPAD